MSKRTKRTPEETQAAVDAAKDLVKGGMPVSEALTKMKLQPSSWYKYKGKRKTYDKKQVVVSEVEPVKLTGTKTMFIITDDPEVIERMLEKMK